MYGEDASTEEDIFQLLVEKEGKKKKTQRDEILKSLGVERFFDEGTITINQKTCQGLECELCIKTCPSKALYWKDGEIGILEDLCVYCGACVLCCIVDDCIRITRKRSNAATESFSKPSDVILVCRKINAKKRHQVVESLSSDAEAYLKRYG
ncbi:MAG: hypothetical protein JSV64_05850 [Candidatus Bathyarchaeota archaeon]|jgi:Fe-S-cluster-containing hydrogenase component 2|nr:MAG: hypothetical protein JSV64_05850 [Candidatus Bathyarchaeota archaeon]